MGLYRCFVYVGVRCHGTLFGRATYRDTIIITLEEGMSKKEFLQKVLYPVVRVSGKKGVGSGTVIWSQKVGDVFETYILTNNHVVAGNVKIEEKYDSFVGQNMPSEIRSFVSVEFFRYPSGSKLEGTFSIKAEIVAYSEQMDLALLKLNSESKADYVALLPEEGLDRELVLSDEVFAVGAALGNAPIITHGRINGMSDYLDDYPYWLSDAQIIFGNSGGAVFLEETSTFIGVPSQVSLTQMGWAVSAVTHIGWFIPFTTVYSFLESNFYSFIFDSEIDALESHEARVETQDEMQRMADVVLVKKRKTHKGKLSTGYQGNTEEDDYEDDTQ